MLKQHILWLTALPVCAHTVSMSTSRLDVQSGRAVLELRLPEYEMRHVANPDRTIPQAITINDVAVANTRCTTDAGAYVCRGEYSISGDQTLHVRCKLARVIVENHVHVMHASRAGRVDQAVFDFGTEEAVLGFRQAGVVETAIRSRPQLVGILLLATLAAGVLASIAGCAAFVAAGLAALALRFWTWQLSPGFTEAAVAVISAYAAFEALFFPPGKTRVIAAGVLGLVLGTYVFGIVPAAGAGSTMLFAAAVAAALVTFITRRAVAAAVFAAALAWVIWAIL